MTGTRQYLGLTAPERAAAEASPHLSTCDVPELVDCPNCVVRMRVIRGILAAAGPVIVSQATRAQTRSAIYSGTIREIAELVEKPVHHHELRDRVRAAIRRGRALAARLDAPPGDGVISTP